MKQIMFFSFVLWTSSLFAQSINSNLSVVNFSVKNMGFKTVEGSFSGMQGEVLFNPANLKSSRFDVCIDASSVNTNNEKRDEHLLNEDFFEVDTYPTICFVSSNIESTDEGFIAEGMLSMHGEIKEASIPFAFINNTLAGNLSVDRLDYKLGENFGKFMVGYDIAIDIQCVLE